MVHAGHEFDRIAGDYDRHRPDYPEELLTSFHAHIEAGEHPAPRLVVDVGAGTGIATRLLRGHLDSTYRLIGLEPGEGMRRQAEDSTTPELGIRYLEATAEEMPFADSSLAGVVVAQAVQWFDRPRFYREACRVLAPGGTLAILQNNRDWEESRFLDAYESFLEQNSPAYRRDYRAFDIQTELSAVPGLAVSPPLAVGWERPMTVEGFIGMARSSSRLQQVIQHVGETHAVTALRDLAGSFADADDTLPVRYQSELYLARRIT